MGRCKATLHTYQVVLLSCKLDKYRFNTCAIPVIFNSVHLSLAEGGLRAYTCRHTFKFG